MIKDHWYVSKYSRNNPLLVICNPFRVSLLKHSLFLSVGDKSIRAAASFLQLLRYRRKSFLSHYISENILRYMMVTIVTLRRSSFFDSYGLTSHFLLWMYSVILRTFRQSKNLLNMEQNFEVSFVAGNPSSALATVLLNTYKGTINSYDV